MPTGSAKIKDIDELEEVVARRQLQLDKVNLPMQPFGVVLNFDEYIIVSSEVRYECESCVRAVELLYKTFHALNLEYPSECKHIWHFIQEMIGIIGGSGLDNPEILSNRTEKRVTTPYGNPSDALILGDIEGVEIVILARHGRKHDLMPSNVNYRANIWALKEEGCTHVVATNACGSLQEEIPPGTLVVIDSFIDWTYKRKQTFYDGEPNHPEGICHMPMEPAFCQHTRKVIIETARDVGVEVQDGGTIVAEEGPEYCSKSESCLFKSWGAHLVGMTTVPEVVLAKEAGLCYAAIAMATDYDCWREGGETVSHKLVLSIFEKNVEKVLKLLEGLVLRMAKEDWTKTIEEAQVLAKDSVSLSDKYHKTFPSPVPI